jgi:hypothetical protein
MGGIGVDEAISGGIGAYLGVLAQLSNGAVTIRPTAARRVPRAVPLNFALFPHISTFCCVGVILSKVAA